MSIDTKKLPTESPNIKLENYIFTFFINKGMFFMFSNVYSVKVWNTLMDKRKYLLHPFI